MPINVTTTSALVVTTGVTSDTEFGESSGIASQAKTLSSQSTVPSPRAQLRVEESHKIKGDVLGARVRSELA